MYNSTVTGVLRRILDAAAGPLRVIEIGTAYGAHLHQLKGCANLLELVSIDPMYDWVPDLRPDDLFEESKVDAKKLNEWNSNAEGLPASLIVGKSHDVASTGMVPHSDFDVLLVDGCHHPPEAVAADYWDFVKYLKADHIVIFDDVNQHDPKMGAGKVVDRLKAEGARVDIEDTGNGQVRVLRVSRPG